MLFLGVASLGLSEFPLKRSFLQFPVQEIPRSILHHDLRVLQFNMLADGLSGLRKDLGAFSRVTSEAVSWENRKDKLLKELVQYSPDIITMQENDHYYDFFLIELNALGYDGYFAPKPASACLEVSDRSDGCAVFVRRSQLRIVSAQTITYVLSSEDRDEEIREFHKYAQVSEERRNKLRAQNQVALILVAELKDVFAGYVPPIVIGTTHLKATKTEAGERFRQREALQFLDSVSKVCDALIANERPPALILTGDFNSMPILRKYEPLTYRSIKQHPLGLRSVLNDDVGSTGTSDGEVYTTWKARKKGGEESIVKHCIDYIFYSPFRGRDSRLFETSQVQKWPAFIREGAAIYTNRDTSNDGVLIGTGFKQQAGFRALAVLDLFDVKQFSERFYKK